MKDTVPHYRCIRNTLHHSEHNAAGDSQAVHASSIEVTDCVGGSLATRPTSRACSESYAGS